MAGALTEIVSFTATAPQPVAVQLRQARSTNSNTVLSVWVNKTTASATAQVTTVNLGGTIDPATVNLVTVATAAGTTEVAVKVKTAETFAALVARMASIIEDQADAVDVTYTTGTNSGTLTFTGIPGQAFTITTSQAVAGGTTLSAATNTTAAAGTVASMVKMTEFEIDLKNDGATAGQQKLLIELTGKNFDGNATNTTGTALSSKITHPVTMSAFIANANA